MCASKWLVCKILKPELVSGWFHFPYYRLVNEHHQSEATFIISQCIMCMRFMPLWPYVIKTRILADHLEILVVKTMSTSGLHIIEQNTLDSGFESQWNLWLLIFGKLRWKLMRTRHMIAFCLCALHMLSNANLYYGKESNGGGYHSRLCV